MSLKLIFTWWNKQTLGTFLKTLFFGKYVGSDSNGNKYYIFLPNEKSNNLFPIIIKLTGSFSQKVFKFERNEFSFHSSRNC